MSEARPFVQRLLGEVRLTPWPAMSLAAALRSIGHQRDLAEFRHASPDEKEAFIARRIAVVARRDSALEKADA